MTTTPVASVIPKVWVMRPDEVDTDNPSFPWDWSKWTPEPRLIPQRSYTAPSSDGAATFKLVRRIQYAPGGPDFAAQSSPLRAGVYVCISTADSVTGTVEAPITLPNIEAISWFGVITAIDDEIVGAGGRIRSEGTIQTDLGDSVGTVSAREVGGAILDTFRVTGFKQANTAKYARSIKAPPTANMRDSGGQIIGNAVYTENDNSTPVNRAYLFARELIDCGSDPTTEGDKYWTPYRLATHIVTYCKPAGLPAIIIEMEDGSGGVNGQYIFNVKALAEGNPRRHTTLASWLDDATRPEVFDLENLTWKGALDMIAGSGAGLGWRLKPRLVSGLYKWVVTIFSRSGLAQQSGAPKSNATSWNYLAEDRRTKQIEFSEDDATRYDEVIVRGNQIVFGVSVSFLDNNLNQGWTSAQQTKYEAASGSERGKTDFADVFTSYVLNRSTPNGGMTLSKNPGTGSATIPLTPELDWTAADISNGVPKIDDGTILDHYLPALRLSPIVPWREGDGPDGIPTNLGAGKASPSYLRPKVFHYDPALAAPWVDLLSRIKSDTYDPLSETPQVDVDDRRPGIRIAYSRPHVLGFDRFTSDEKDGADPQFDWQKLVVTIGVPSDQRVEARRVRASIADDKIRRSLLINDTDLNCWICRAGTVIGVNSDNTKPLRVERDVFVVNDYPAAQRHCDEIAEWAFRPQVSCTILHTNDGSLAPTQWIVGNLLQRVTEGGTSRIVGAIIASIDTDWTSGTVTIQTETPPQPARGGQSSAPSRGGAVSPELGGTIAQVVQKQGAEMKKVAAQVAARPLIPRMGGGGALPEVNLFLVLGGNFIPGCNTAGIQKRNDNITASELQAGVGGTGIVNMPAFPVPLNLPNGIGVMRHVGTNRYVFGINDLGSGYPYDVPTGLPVLIGGTVNLDVVVGDVTYRYSCLRIVGG